MWRSSAIRAGSCRTPPIILAEDDSFIVYEKGSTIGRVEFADIAEISIYKRDEITTDLICCDVAVSRGRDTATWFLHEEMDGFDELMRRFERLPGFGRDWHDAVVKSPFDECRTVAFRRTT